MDQLLRLALYALRHFIQDIGGLVDESIAAARLGRILPAERSRSQANRHRWPASVRSKAPGVLAAEAVHARIECFRGNRQRQLRVPLVPSSVAAINTSTQVRSSSSRTLK